MRILIQLWFVKQGLIVLGSQRQKPENGNLEQYKSLFFYVCLVFSIFLVTSAWSWPIPESGQDKCYDDVGNVIACPQPGEPFYGQDANYSINPRSYTKLDAQGNALPDSATEWVMVKDNVTGLIWEVKTDDGGIHDKDDQYTWQGAQDEFITELNNQNFSGHSDWRMPTIKELASLANLGTYNPAIDTEYFPNTVSARYWSSTNHANAEDGATWIVYFGYGNDHSHSKSYSYYVRAVRSGQHVLFDDLIVHGDGTVTDPNSGLMWQRATAENKMTWSEALNYCENLNLAEHTDWRLPTREELRSIVNYDAYDPAIDKQVFPDTASSSYWSTTTLATDVEDAWRMGFLYGDDYDGYDHGKSDTYYVRAVREGLAVSNEPGILKWKFQAGDDVDTSSPAIGSDGTIYIGSNDGKLYAINENGTKKWFHSTELAIKSSPSIGSDGTIYIGSYDGKLYAINHDGSLRWKFDTGDDIFSTPAISSDGIIYVGSDDNNLYAINPDGSLKWNFTAGKDIGSSPAIGLNGTIYFGCHDGNIYAVNQNGKLLWTFKTGLDVKSSPAIDSNGTLYVGSYDDHLYAINPDGSLKWDFEAGETIFSSPAIDSDGTIYVGSYDNHLYAINSDGSLKWDFVTEGNVKSSPAISANGCIYVGSKDNFLYCINSNGTLKWKFKTNDWIYSSPTIDSDGTIYFGSYDNNLYALNIDSSSSSLISWPMFGQNVRHTSAVGKSIQISANVSTGIYPLNVDFAASSNSLDYESWLWDFGDGSNSTEQNPSYSYAEPGEYTVVCTATDQYGTSYSSDPLTVTVLSKNPVSNAGPMQTVCSGDQVVLDGSGSYDPDGSIQSYAWSQTSGQEMSLNSTESKKVHFIAPNVSPSGTALTFELTVTDSNGQSNSSEVLIAVQDCSLQ